MYGPGVPRDLGGEHDGGGRHQTGRPSIFKTFTTEQSFPNEMVNPFNLFVQYDQSL